MDYKKMTKADLVAELKKRDRTVSRLRRDAGTHMRPPLINADGAPGVRHSLRERMKELNCLYVLSSYFDTAAGSPEKALRKLPALLKKSWQYPRDTCARVVMGTKIFATANYKNTRWKQAADVVVGGKKAGRIEVRYLVKKPEEAEGPFLAEERHLLDEVAERVGRSIERTQARENLAGANRQLTANNRQLHAAEQQLRAANRQLTAGNQQLRATEQQLRAGNQQLTASNQQLLAAEQQLRAANQQLAASEARFRRLTENARDMIYRMSLITGTYEYVSPAAEQVTGYAAREWMENPGLIGTVIHPDYREFFKREWEKLQNGEISPTYEYAIIDKAGRERWLHQRNVLVKGRRGKPEYIEGIVTDLTPLKEAERVRETASRQLTSLFNGIDDVIYVSDPETYELLFVNEAVKRNWENDPIGRKCYEVLQGRKEPCPFCTNRIIFDEKPGETHVWEFRNEITKQWYRCADKVIDWPDGRKVRFELASDITERKRMSAALAENEKRFRTLFDNINEGFALHEIITDDGGTPVDYRYLAINPAFEQLTGLPAEASVGKTVCELLPGTADDPADWIGRFGKVALTGEPIVVEDYSVPLGKWFLVNGFCPRHGQFAVTFTDITEKKRAEDELKATMENLERSNRELEQFAYVASHDLQEPLRMVGSYVELLADRYKDKLDEDANDFINFAVDGATRMQRLIRDLLSFSRVHTRGREFETVDTGAVAAEVVRSLGARIKETGAMVTFGNMPTVRADPTQLLQLLQNLVQNGIKFVKNRTPEVRVAAERRGDEWVFSVRDNGIGIDPQYYDKVFIIFQRLHAKAEYGGTGIGLAICKRIVERHQGRIWIESRPGKGATFYFTLPTGEGNT